MSGSSIPLGGQSGVTLTDGCPRSGFEQANKYVIMDANGNHVGYMAEQERGMGNMMARQWFRTHRSFVTHVFDKHENEVLRVSTFHIDILLLFVRLTMSVSPSVRLDQLSHPCV